ncbi:MAG: hypothetical protein ACK4OH_10800 [Acidovorax temperans]|uniref:hypothetical protein n=1 Tax=Acidovorax temperans TaxID=80878 RepID=UPI00391C42DC
MRPAGDVRRALLDACEALAGEMPAGRGPCMREIAEGAGVGLYAARKTVSNMVRAGVLHGVHDRRVGYRNRPVKEYRPTPAATAANDPFAPLLGAMRAWG